MRSDGKIELHMQFMLIGVPRSATTWLTTCLNQHPEIFIPIHELNYWNANKSFGLDWYHKQFVDATNSTLLGENSSLYFADPVMPYQIAKLFPGIKVIVLFRDPVQRAYSHYQLNLRNGKYPYKTDFLWACKNPISPWTDFVEIGRYYTHLIRWQKVLDGNNVKPILYDDIVNKPEVVIQDIFEYLGVDKNFMPDAVNCRVGEGRGMSRYPRLARGARLISNGLRQISGKQWPAIKSSLLKGGMHYLRQTVYRNKITDNETNDQAACRWLREQLIDEINSLEVLLERDLSHWKNNS